MTKNSSKKAKSQRSRERALLKKVHLNAAGIDVGADEPAISGRIEPSKPAKGKQFLSKTAKGTNQKQKLC